MKITNKFRVSPGAHIDRKQVNNYGKEIMRLIKKCGDMISADDIVNISRDVNSPLHNHFNWNDEEAAHNYRKKQARVLLNNIEVAIRYSDGTEKWSSVAYSVKVEIQLSGKAGKVESDVLKKYVPIRTVVKESSYRDQIVNAAFGNLQTAVDKIINIAGLVAQPETSNRVNILIGQLKGIMYELRNIARKKAS